MSTRSWHKKHPPALIGWKKVWGPSGEVMIAKLGIPNDSLVRHDCTSRGNLGGGVIVRAPVAARTIAAFLRRVKEKRKKYRFNPWNADPGKMRTNRAHVLALYQYSRKAKKMKLLPKQAAGAACYDNSFFYQAGRVVVPRARIDAFGKALPAFLESANDTCGGGIHFFATVKEAQAY